MRKLGVYILFLLLSICNLFSQIQNIQGVVVDGDEHPIVGAIISINNDTSKVFTDLDGKFNVKTNLGNILTISFTGFYPIEKEAVPNMKVVFENYDTKLNEIVVTGLTQTDKRLFTGATDRLDGIKIKTEGISDIGRMLEGRSAGVFIQNVSGTFGASPKIQIRGASSILGNSKPLWVIDGVIVEDLTEVSTDALTSGDALTLLSSSVVGLNAEDVESIQILKDGSATSIYGAKAKAGVIVVSTKKGVPGKSTINYTGEYTMRMKPRYGGSNIMNSQEQMGVYKEMESKGWLTISKLNRSSNSGVYGKMYELINQIGNGSVENSAEGKARYLQAAEMRNTDWFDILFNTNIMHNHSVSISSGNEKTTFYGSMSALSDKGWAKQSGVSRYTGNLNVTHRILDNLSLNLITNASYRSQQAPGTLSRTTDLVNGRISRNFDMNPYYFALNSSRALDPNAYYTRNYASFNILNELENNKINLDVADLRFQGEMKWKPIRSIEIGVLGAIKYQKADQEQRITENSNQAMAYRSMADAVIAGDNPYLYIDPDLDFSLPMTVLPYGGFFRRTDYKMKGYDLRASLNYVGLINDKHIINLFAASEINSVDRNNSFFDGVGMDYGMGETAFYMYQFFKKGVEQNNPYYSIAATRGRSVAYVSNGNYSFQERYVLNGTFRYEGSNSLGHSRSARWLPTWNISGAWNVDEEKFFESYRSVFSHLTTKASYSLVGDRGPATINNSRIILKSFTPFRPFADDRELGIEIMNLENENLTYEKKHEFNWGISLGLFNRRLNVDFDWYKRNNFDLIGQLSTQGVGGQILKYANVADMKAHGFELSISSINFRSKDALWTSEFTFSDTRTEVTKLHTKSTIFDLVSNTGFSKVGYPHKALFSIPFKGLNAEGIPTFLDQNGNVTSTDIFFQESENVNFLKYEGSTIAPIFGGLANTLKYQNLSLNFFVTYAFGNVVRLPQSFQSVYTDFDAMPKEFNNRWVLPGDEKYTNIPTIPTSRQIATISNLAYAYNAYNYSDIRVAKGDFVRLKEISLTYDIPPKILYSGFHKVSIKLQATNMFLLYSDGKLKGQDPEFVNSGGVALPMPRQFTFTLRLGL